VITGDSQAIPSYLYVGHLANDFAEIPTEDDRVVTGVFGDIAANSFDKHDQVHPILTSLGGCSSIATGLVYLSEAVDDSIVTG
jgi:hypothetical protein